MKRKPNGQFTSEGVRGNQFAKGNPPNKTSFKKGHTPANFKGVYKPRVIHHKRDGWYVDVTIEETKPAVSRGKKYTTKKRVNYARVVTNAPKGLVAYHIDGNQLNNDPSNLELITRAELLKRNLENRRN